MGDKKPEEWVLDTQRVKLTLDHTVISHRQHLGPWREVGGELEGAHHWKFAGWGHAHHPYTLSL